MSRLALLVVTVIAAVAVTRGAQQRQTFAPHELKSGDAPPAIVWDTPDLPKHPVSFESAEERRLRLDVVARGLEQPWSMAFLPDGAMLITERAGHIRVLRGRELSAPIEGVPTVQTGGSRGLQGLMDVVLHPDFAHNHWVYLTYHKPIGDGDAGAITLARGTWTGERLADVRDIFESGATDTEASRLVFGRDGMIYLSISAPGSPKFQRAQDPGDYAGKVVRLRDDGSVPADDPFVGRAGYKPAIFTMGHRNGHALAVNPETGDIWATEQGPSGGDELNILRAGRNYGWPFVSYGRDYWGEKVSPRPSVDGFEDPAVVWLPSIGLTGMTFYTGDRFPHWKRNVFVGGLREGGVPRTGQIQRIVFNERWEELRREPLLTDLKQRIRDVRQGPDGLLYVLTAEEDGALLRIEPR
ncbi:MAG TPA: PQQ-dependent sugar dehydrogenase [Vicinamibacterales bacterium]|nr:PQQ-dependent sugar dehydrogenase [Vicinamibacterales bacterium]